MSSGTLRSVIESMGYLFSDWVKMRFGAYSCDSVPTGPAKYGKIKKFRPVVCKVLKLAIDTEKILIFWPLLS